MARSPSIDVADYRLVAQRADLGEVGAVGRRLEPFDRSRGRVVRGACERSRVRVRVRVRVSRVV